MSDSYLGYESIDVFDSEDAFGHFGTKRHSGRYPWGSGKNPYQRSRDFVARYTKYEQQGLSEKEILDAMKMSTWEFRAMNTIANNERRAAEVQRAEELKAEGKSNTEIARIMGYNNESSVRLLLDEGAKERMYKGEETANYLKAKIDNFKSPDNYGCIDVGEGVERYLGISKEKLKVAEEMLKAEGYNIYKFNVKQSGDQYTTTKVIAPPGVSYRQVYEDMHNAKINSIVDFETIPNINNSNPGKTSWVPKRPSSIDSSRVKIRYADEANDIGVTGDDRDGLIEIRPGCQDLNLGDSRYAQVRIMVDGTHYLKGMATYSDDIPEGYDIVFNTNKSSKKSKMEVLKPIKDDPDNPFGALLKEGGQYEYIDKVTGEKKLGAINKTREEGDWGEWSKNLPSQFLAKQNITLIKKQIDLAMSDKQAEYDEIMDISNPTLRKHYLREFADDCDSAAEQLKAAALPRQKYQVIVPVGTLKDNEIFAPNFKDGEYVSLVRFPHEGTFEIVQGRVNNHNKEAIALYGNNPADAVGINKNNANKLSGADYDGDTVLVIPTNSKVKITATPSLKELKDFDSKSYQGEMQKDENGHEHYYRNGKEYRTMKKSAVQGEMGKISNLISDMTLQGANERELARATKHAMVVIDAEKHKLDYKQSELDNNIKELKVKYQDGGGASTILSQAKSERHVPRRKGQGYINQKGKPWYDPDRPEGAMIYKTAPDKELYYTKKKELKNGTIKEETRMRTTTTTAMAITDDAKTLMSKNPNEKELIYAKYANDLKAMANSARLEYAKTPRIAMNKEAKEKYEDEVKDLNYQLNVSKMNAPRERQARIYANSVTQAKIEERPTMTKEEKSKLATQELNRARKKFGAERQEIKVTDSQWKAMESGAISDSILAEMYNKMNSDDLRARAMPKTNENKISKAKEAQIKSYLASGYTQSEIAEELGISASTVLKYK